MIEHDAATAMNPPRLPSIRTPNTSIANPNDTISVSSVITVPLAALAGHAVDGGRRPVRLV